MEATVGRRYGNSTTSVGLDFNKYDMDVARHIMRVLGDNSLLVSVMGATHFRPLPRNKGLAFYTSGNRHKGWVKVRRDDIEDKYSILYLPSGKGEVTEQKGVSEEDLVNELINKVGQSPMVLDYLIDMYLIK